MTPRGYAAILALLALVVILCAAVFCCIHRMQQDTRYGALQGTYNAHHGNYSQSRTGGIWNRH